jgi:hypothetical protein
MRQSPVVVQLMVIDRHMNAASHELMSVQVIRDRRTFRAPLLPVALAQARSLHNTSV